MAAMAARFADWAEKVGILWLLGFREACCLHRVVFFCRRSRPLAVRTGQCFLLNGLIFLGSLYILNSLVIPSLDWILPDHCIKDGLPKYCSTSEVPQSLYNFLKYILVQLFYILWFYPLYILSYALSIIWYNDIAKHALASIPELNSPAKKPEKMLESQPQSSNRPPGFGGYILMILMNGLKEKGVFFLVSSLVIIKLQTLVISLNFMRFLYRLIIGIGEQIYSILLLVVFFGEVTASGYIPYFGKAINFVLLSWMYAYYCFEYKWNFVDLTLEKRLDFFESNWAFFAGFGSPCVMAIFFFSPLLSYGVMATLFPLFVLTAIGTEVEKVIGPQIKSWGGTGSGKLPVFYVADTLSMGILNLVQDASSTNRKND